MDVIYSLIPSMIFIGLVLVGILIWAVKRGQYEDLEGDAHRILLDEDDEMMKVDRRSWPDADEDNPPSTKD